MKRIIFDERREKAADEIHQLEERRQYIGAALDQLHQAVDALQPDTAVYDDVVRWLSFSDQEAEKAALAAWFAKEHPGFPAESFGRPAELPEVVADLVDAVRTARDLSTDPSRYWSGTKQAFVAAKVTTAEKEAIQRRNVLYVGDEERAGAIEWLKGLCAVANAGPKFDLRVDPVDVSQAMPGNLAGFVLYRDADQKGRLRTAYHFEPDVERLTFSEEVAPVFDEQLQEPAPEMRLRPIGV